ncbi:MAG: SRPBCC family protein [Bacteroidota bacterium]
MTAVWLLLLVLLVGCASRPLPESSATGTNRAFVHTLLVAASPEAVWQIWTDVDGWPRWDTELREARIDGDFAEGTRGRLQPISGPSASFEITDLDPGHSYTIRTRLPMAGLYVRRSWAPAGEGSIAITHEVWFGGLLAGLFASRLGPTFWQALPGVMERVRRLAEAAP